MKRNTKKLLSFFLLIGIFATASFAATQTINSSPLISNWGLDRIDQRLRPLSGTYNYTNTGAGVNVYVLDNGINISHQEFGGRAIHAYNATLDGGGLFSPCDDHGTHVAGIIGGANYGVAKQATLYSVRTATCGIAIANDIDDSIIRGLRWVRQNHVKPAVVNLSLAKYLIYNGDFFISERQQTIEAEIDALIDEGVTVVAGAGNAAVDASLFSPARIPRVITVSASTINDQKLSWSAYGPAVDITAPGDLIISASNASVTATAVKSGTSMSTAFVSGAVAKYLQSNPTATPAQVSQYIYNNATWAFIPDPGDGTPDHFLFDNL